MAAITMGAGSSSGSAPMASIPTHMVGSAFAYQYYLILRTSPDTVYHGESCVTRPSAARGRGMDSVTTLKAIKKVKAMGKVLVDVETVESKESESYADGITVLVRGRASFLRGQPLAFSQSFLLAPQDGGGYFVLEVTLTYAENAAHAAA